MGYPYKPKAYSALKTVWKMAKSAGVLGSGALSTVAFPGPDDGPLQWVLFAALLTPPLVEGVRNYQKNKD